MHNCVWEVGISYFNIPSFHFFISILTHLKCVIALQPIRYLIEGWDRLHNVTSDSPNKDKLVFSPALQIYCNYKLSFLFAVIVFGWGRIVHRLLFIVYKGLLSFFNSAGSSLTKHKIVWTCSKAIKTTLLDALNK